MIPVLKILGILLFIGPAVGFLMDLVAWVPPVWGVMMFGFALAAIPSEYSISFFRVVAWLIMLFSIYVIGSGEYGNWALLAFFVFVFSGVAAGLPFEADKNLSG